MLQLSYIAVICREPENVAQIFAGLLGCVRREVTAMADGWPVPVIPVGDTALAFFAPGAAAVQGELRTGVHHIAISASDPAETVERLFGASGGDWRGPGLLPETHWVPADQSAHIRCAVTPAIARGTAETGANGCLLERLDHIGVACADNAAAEAILVNQLGLPVESRQTDVQIQTAFESFTSDKYGTLQHQRSALATGGVRVVFIGIGDTDLELLQPLSAAHLNAQSRPQSGGAPSERPLPGPGSTENDGGTLGRYVAKHGTGLHHLAFKVAAIDPVLTRLADAGLPMLDRIGRFGSRRAKIGFAHPKAFGGLLVHFVERTPL